jgi:hypothetical protein
VPDDTLPLVAVRDVGASGALRDADGVLSALLRDVATEEKGGERVMKRFWLWFLAFFRLSDAAICEMSRGKGWYDDYHDYGDSREKQPLHFVPLKCERCGKEFCI